MPINPFGPVWNNLLIPLGQSLVQPYAALLNTSLSPLYQAIRKPCKNYDQAVERFEALIKTVELVIQFSAYFFLYQKGCHLGVHYLGLIGGAVTFSLIYGAGCWLDQKLKTQMNSICTGTWLYYKGISSLQSNREWMLLAIIIGGHLTRQHEQMTEKTAWDQRRTTMAKSLANFFYGKLKPVEQPAGNPPAHQNVDSLQDPLDGKSK